MEKTVVAPGIELWQNYLSRARWFQGKGLVIAGFTIEALPWYSTDSPIWVRSELAHINYGAELATYHLLVGYLPIGEAEPEALVGQIDLPGRGLVDMVDLPRSPKATQTLLDSLADLGITGMVWHLNPGDLSVPTQALSAEQTNSTVRVGDSLLFKVYRKVSRGRNHEPEMMSALSGSGIIPRLIGTLSTPDLGYDLGIFCERIEDAQDGWAYCTKARMAGRGITDEMTNLGRTLATLHTELARGFGVSTIDSSEISTQMLTRLDAACHQVPELDPICHDLRTTLTLPTSPVEIQRVHGDFHLGQTLFSPQGIRIIDFEGEPLKTPEERAAADTVWRDVAGLTRSLDYVRSSHGGTDSHQWYLDAREAFLDGYSKACVPHRLLRAYEIDKAIYELVYEVRNRPTWADIPRQAITEAIAESKQTST